MILVQKLKFFRVLCLLKIDQEKVFLQSGSSIVFVKNLRFSSTLIFMENKPRKSILERSS